MNGMATHSIRNRSTTPRRLSRSTSRIAALALVVAGATGVAIPASAQLGGAKSTDIGLKALKFTPGKVTVAKGAKVNFVWKEKVAHNIVVDAKHKSPTLNKGVWTTSFDKAGTYKYKCTIHPGMTGEITVK